nr:MAG TPA: hypothetical protein [Caudoviricetes sp.]
MFQCTKILILSLLKKQPLPILRQKSCHNAKIMYY